MRDINEIAWEIILRSVDLYKNELNLLEKKALLIGLKKIEKKIKSMDEEGKQRIFANLLMIKNILNEELPKEFYLEGD